MFKEEILEVLIMSDFLWIISQQVITSQNVLLNTYLTAKKKENEEIPVSDYTFFICSGLYRFLKVQVPQYWSFRYPKALLFRYIWVLGLLGILLKNLKNTKKLGHHGNPYCNLLRFPF